MATIPDFIEALAPVTGMHPATLQRYISDLTRSGKIRKSGKGGGRVAVHINETEAATVLLSLAALTPSGASAAVDRLAPLCRGRGPGNTIGLLDTLARDIHERSHIVAYDPQASPPVLKGWQLVLSVDPPAAFMTWTADGKVDREDFHHPAETSVSAPGFRRQTVIVFDQIDAAARIVADGLVRTETLTRIQAGRPVSETASAGLPARSSSARVHPSRKRPVSLNAADLMRLGFFVQFQKGTHRGLQTQIHCDHRTVG